MTTEDEWIGIAFHGGKLFVFRGIVGEFILDYRAYDPEFSQTPGAREFRGGIITANSDNAAVFLRAMQAAPLSRSDALNMAQQVDQVIAFIDFDSRRFVHSYFDLPLEDYVPRGWYAQLGDPLDELKTRLRTMRSE